MSGQGFGNYYTVSAFCAYSNWSYGLDGLLKAQGSPIELGVYFFSVILDLPQLFLCSLPCARHLPPYPSRLFYIPSFELLEPSYVPCSDPAQAVIWWIKDAFRERFE